MNFTVRDGEDLHRGKGRRATGDLVQMEASLRRLTELRGDVTLRDWIDLLIKETGWGARKDGGKVSPNTIRTYELGARAIGLSS